MIPDELLPGGAQSQSKLLQRTRHPQAHVRSRKCRLTSPVIVGIA